MSRTKSREYLDELLFNVPSIISFIGEMRSASKPDRYKVDIATLARHKTGSRAIRLAAVAIAPEFLQTLDLLRAREQKRGLRGIGMVIASTASAIAIGLNFLPVVAQLTHPGAATQTPDFIRSDLLFTAGLSGQLAIHLFNSRNKRLKAAQRSCTQ